MSTANTEIDTSVPSAGIPEWVRINFEALENSLNGNKTKPIHKVRKQALELLKLKGLPTPKDEEWKYTNISEVSSKNFKLNQASSKLKLDDISKYLIAGNDAHRLVFVDGRFTSELSNLELGNEAVKGLSLSSLNSALENAAQFKDYYSSISLDGKDFATDLAIVALNTAFANEGLAINVSGGTKIEKSIQLLFVTTAKEEGVFSPARVLINAAKGSSIDVVESHVALGEKYYLSAPLTEINIAENAEVNFYKIGSENQASYHLGNIILKQERDSRSNIMLFTLGGKIVRNEVHLKLNGNNCNAMINGLSVLSGQQHVDNHTVIDHAMPNSESREKIKGIYADKSKGVFNGTIIVREDAQKTNAYQSNQTILLSKDATIDTKPQLKIWADDVKCTHGATVGQLDDNAMFYLRSRGIEKNTARNMLVHAFASEIFSEIKEESLKVHLETLLSDKLNLIEAQ